MLSLVITCVVKCNVINISNLFPHSLDNLFYTFAISFALDTAALLGGNEYLIKQMLTEIENLEYNEKELEVLKWGLTEVKFCILISYKIINFILKL